MKKKYELIPDYDSGNYRVKALTDFGTGKRTVHQGDIGGIVKDEFTLSQNGDCWIGKDVDASCNGIRIMDDAFITGNVKFKKEPGTDNHIIVKKETYIEGGLSRDYGRKESAVEITGNCELACLLDRDEYGHKIVEPHVQAAKTDSKILIDNTDLSDSPTIRSESGANINLYDSAVDNFGIVINTQPGTESNLYNVYVTDMTQVQGNLKLSRCQVKGRSSINGNGIRPIECQRTTLHDDCHIMNEAIVTDTELGGEITIKDHSLVEQAYLSGRMLLEGDTQLHNKNIEGEHHFVDGIDKNSNKIKMVDDLVADIEQPNNESQFDSLPSDIFG